MTVTQITEINKSRSKVYIEQEFAFVLYKGELRKYRIRLGEELADQDYAMIMSEVLPKRAKLRLMNLLKEREYTTEQLRKKLNEGGYPGDVAQQALDYVASFHYVDDARYAYDYIVSCAARNSRRLIEQKLKEKGIDGNVIKKAFLKWEEQGGIQEEETMIRTLLEKKQYNPDDTDKKEQLRLYHFLLRKGFSGEKISRALCFCISST